MSYARWPRSWSPAKVEEEELQSALQAILFHQCLYEDWPHAPSYRLLVRHLAHVQPILAAFGFRLMHHPVAHMLVLEAKSQVYGVHLARLKKDETIVLLVLRLLYAEGVSRLDESGRVEITPDDVHDRIRTSGEEPPDRARLFSILRLLQRKGLVRLGDYDTAEKLSVVAIMPGITILVPDIYVEAVIQWLESRTLEERDKAADGTRASDMLAHVADYRAHLGAAPERVASASEQDDLQAETYPGEEGADDVSA